jgi:hypothetical protein
MAQEQPREQCVAQVYVGWMGADDPGRGCAYYALPGGLFCGKHDQRRIAQRKHQTLSRLLGLRDIDALIRNRPTLNAIAGYRRKA